MHFFELFGVRGSDHVRLFWDVLGVGLGATGPSRHYQHTLLGKPLGWRILGFVLLLGRAVAAL